MSSWVIQDGNYPDFVVGERRAFALEFFDRGTREPVRGLHEAAPGIRSAQLVGQARYEITAEVAYAGRDFVLLDFGLLAYSDRQGATATLGAWRSGTVLLEVDHFAYFETHAKKDGAPRLSMPGRSPASGDRPRPGFSIPTQTQISTSEIPPVSDMPHSIGLTPWATRIGTRSTCSAAGSRATRRRTTHDDRSRSQAPDSRSPAAAGSQRGPLVTSRYIREYWQRAVASVIAERDGGGA